MWAQPFTPPARPLTAILHFNEMFVTTKILSKPGRLIRETNALATMHKNFTALFAPTFSAPSWKLRQPKKFPVVGHINRQIGALEVLKIHTGTCCAFWKTCSFHVSTQPPTDAELEEFANAVAASHITVTPNLNVNPTNIAQLKELGRGSQFPRSAASFSAAYSQWMPANNRNERNDQTAQQIQQMIRSS